MTAWWQFATLKLPGVRKLGKYFGAWLRGRKREGEARAILEPPACSWLSERAAERFGAIDAAGTVE